jgi:predicted MFS family arabinose efflux permease
MGSASWLLFGLGAVFGPVIAGMVADRIGIGRALMLAFAVKAGAVLLPVLTTSLPGLAVSSILVGALSPGLAGLAAARITELFGRNRQSQVWGFATLGFSIAQASGGYGFSLAYARFGAYPPLFLSGGILELVGLTLVSLAWVAGRSLARAR